MSLINLPTELCSTHDCRSVTNVCPFPVSSSSASNMVQNVLILLVLFRKALRTLRSPEVKSFQQIE